MRKTKQFKKGRGRGPIGIFDSGVGGLTVAREIIRFLPSEDIVYFGDTAHVPYGNKSKEMVTNLSSRIVKFLLRKRVKLIVVACNTASSYSLSSLRRKFSVPIIGVVEPGVRKALEMTRNRRIGIIGTSGTIRSGTYERFLCSRDKKVRVYSQSCPLFVPLVEEGWFRSPVTQEVIKYYLTPLKRADADTLILGCTHYPMLKNAIQNAMGKSVRLVDSAREVAKKVKGMVSPGKRKGRVSFYVSDDPKKFVEIGKKFIGKRLADVRLIRMP